MVGKTNISGAASSLGAAKIHIVAFTNSIITISKNNSVVKTFSTGGIVDSDIDTIEHYFYNVTPSNFAIYTITVNYDNRVNTYTIPVYQIREYETGILPIYILGGIYYKNNFTYAKNDNSTIVWDTDNIHTYQTNTGGRGIRLITINKIDLTNFNNLYVEFTRSGDGAELDQRYGVSDNAIVLEANFNAYVDLYNTNVKTTISCNISNINEEKYVASWTGVGDTKVYRIWLE